MSRLRKVFQERKNVSTEVPSPCCVEIHLRLLTLKELFIHNLHIFLFFFFFLNVCLTRNVDEKSSVIYSMKKKRNKSISQGVFPVVSEDRCVP